jgi:DNA helicase-2/ATP-dependent DNA helicase PcrA
VPCFTIHASKGLEFRHVYLIAMNEDQLPSWPQLRRARTAARCKKSGEIAFVAITRTEETLTMTYSNYIFGWGKRPSRFLLEMGYSV